ncbi:MAG TPA: glycosyltransferase [Roseimicrobium sp.]|nr:glycosyltransferase [Roseimicrobium sp.]
MMSINSCGCAQLIRRVGRDIEDRRLSRRILRIVRKNPLTRLLNASFSKWSPTRRWLDRTRREQLITGLRGRSNASHWTIRNACPLALYDAGGAQVGDRLYLIRGYQNLGVINDKVFAFDMATECWTETSPPPARLAHSHAGICSDSTRFIYITSGQLGTQCSPAISDSFSFDTVLGIWSDLPPLPEPRYAGTMQLIGGRLHFIGGALADRYTPSSDHWSLAVAEGRALENHWRKEPSLPLPVMHLGSAMIEGAFYTFGGQQGDFTAIPGDPDYTCTGKTRESFFPDVYRYRPGELNWTRLSDLPIPVSHIDFSVLHENGKVHVFGGQIYKDPEDFRLRLTDAIQSYDVATDRWSISGAYPYRVKTPICGLHDGTVFCAGGQRDKHSANDSPGSIVNDTWCIKLSPLFEADQSPDYEDAFSSLRGKEVVLISHNLTITGAPLLMLELACALRDSGAIVRIFSAADDAEYGNAAERLRLPVLPIETSIVWAARAELVIANTCVAGPWISHYLALHPSRTSRLIWWIHENAVNSYVSHLPGTENVQTVVFDSHSARSAWEPLGIGVNSQRFVVHPGNRNDIREAAGSPRLPWPIAPEEGAVNRDMARQRLGVSNEDFLLCCIGTVHAKKGQKLLLDTVGGLLARHPDLRVRVLVVGYRDAAQRRKALRSLSSSAKKAVLGGKLLLLQNPDIRAFYLASDAFVMNSQGAGETFGRVTIEAMAFGLPVLATAAGGTIEIISDGETGLLHPVGDAGLETLAANIRRLVQDQALAKRLGAAGRKHAEEHFSAHRFFREMDGVIKKISPM